MVLFWLLVGVVVVSVSFFIPGHSADLWPSLNAAGIAAAIYLLALFEYIFRRPISIRGRVVGVILVLIVAAAVVTFWLGTYETTHWQANQLQKIHSVIMRGLLQAEVSDSMLVVLQDYHKQGRVKKASLGTIFLQKFLGATLGTNIHPPYLMNRPPEADRVNIECYQRNYKVVGDHTLASRLPRNWPTHQTRHIRLL
jgi:hypothetical protein